MSTKRTTIYDLAASMGISPSYVSRALNNHPLVRKDIIEAVKKKAVELNYKHNSHAANLRLGTSKTIGVIVPHINQSFFSEAIAGIEEVCFENNHSLIICQSHESFQHECKAIETLIHQNVDCILISISAETKSIEQLKTIKENNIELVQFDRYINSLKSYTVVNDNMEASYAITKKMIGEGYKTIGFLGGPSDLSIFKDRKQGYLKAVKEAGLKIPPNFIVDDVLPKEKAAAAAAKLLALKNRPDAFITVSDHQSLAVLQTAESLGIKAPGQIGVAGFANEEFTEITKPTLSSVDQKSKELGKRAANLYFRSILKTGKKIPPEKKEIVKSEIIIRQSFKKRSRLQ